MTAAIRVLIEHAQTAVQVERLVAMINAAEGSTEKTQLNNQSKQMHSEAMWTHYRKRRQLSALLHEEQN